MYRQHYVYNMNVFKSYKDEILTCRIVDTRYNLSTGYSLKGTVS